MKHRLWCRRALFIVSMYFGRNGDPSDKDTIRQFDH